MIHEKTKFSSAGRTFAGTFFEPSTAPQAALDGHDDARAGRPAVMVLHGGAGVSDHEIARAQRLAALGYVAFVPDLFGEPFQSREHGIAVITGLVGDPSALRGRLTDALACMLAHPRVDSSRAAAIGFCFGGLAALELARSGAALRGVVSFHGGLTTAAPAEPGRIQAAVLVCTGAADPFVTRDHRSAFEREMMHANPDWELQLYGPAAHGFTEQVDGPGHTGRPGSAYHGPSDRRSWRAMCMLFDEVLALK